MIQIKLAETKDELEGILSLQARNFKTKLTEQEARDEGFVTVHHDFETLELMNSYEPQIIAVEDDEVVGYALVMAQELKHNIPVLEPMFRKLSGLYFGSSKISDTKYYVMGQVCIDKSYRGKGLFKNMYDMHKIALAEKYEFCITEVSESNKRSMRAHEKVGFENIHAYSDDTDNWNILLWDLKKN